MGFWCIEGKSECEVRPISGHGPREELVEQQKIDAELEWREGKNPNRIEPIIRGQAENDKG